MIFKKKNLTIICSFFILFITFIKPSLAQSNLCDYAALLNSAADKKERDEREVMYLKLIGLLNDLQGYRNSFISNGDLVNLFPTIYYHTTYLEMDRIRIDVFEHPVEKMRQMLYFYDSYIMNRRQFDMNKSCGEEHWSRHFKEVEDSKSLLGSQNLFCNGLRKVLNSAIRAHVRFDLARAIRFAFDSRSDIKIVAKMLENDFLKTNTLFSESQKLSINDILVHHPICGSLGGAVANKEWLGAISTSEIISWREEAFKNAIINRIPLIGYGGIPLMQQPSFAPYDNFLQIGKKLCGNKSISLFLFDVSGSMNEAGKSGNSKIVEAKGAAITTLGNLNQSTVNAQPFVAVKTFSGACSQDPTSAILDYTSDLKKAENAINSIPMPDGGTPLPQAIEVSKANLLACLKANNQKQGKLIVLSDGQSSCGAIRPPDVYGQSPILVTNPQGTVANPIVKNYAIGFNIAPGSDAERDLQYLAQMSGGKYLNAQDQLELTKAFQKFSRVYVPKPYPSVDTISATAKTIFSKAVDLIDEEDFPKALDNCKQFTKNNLKDCNGFYNLALMYEANEFFKSAIKNYESYLQLCPNPTDKDFVLKQIEVLKKDYEKYVEYQKQVVQSDLEYLNLHFKKIQNGESVALAIEFVGFLKEKWTYYQNLAAIVENEDRLFKTNATEVFKGLKNCVETIKRNPQAWDRDATPVLSRTYLNMERLIQSF